MSHDPPARIWMEAALAVREVRTTLPFRHPAPEDCADLAELMFDAYRGTTDSSSIETLDDALAETRSYFEGESGSPLLDCSFIVEDHGLPVCASLITLYEGAPLLVCSLTEPSYAGQGLATTVVQLSMNALAAHGHATLRLAVTRGDIAAERVCEKLGFREIT
ncbi:MAG TPA: GNAT family N-acetyltransferase [Thermomicrobiales bacterium]|nr:GNAT family N-acetyltransferase [Thermomicrobiales bacterium]